MNQAEGEGRRSAPNKPRLDSSFILPPSSLFTPHAAIFGDAASLTDAIIAPALLTPKLTLNCAHGPIAVERTAWIWYVTCDEPAGIVASTNSFAPTPPR